MRLLGTRCSYTCFYLVVAIGQVFCKTCPPLKSDSVNIDCEFDGDVVDCESPIIRGTRAHLNCKDSYNIPPSDDPGYRDLTCLADGAWDHPLFKCIPECGTAVAHGTPLIINGQTATRGAFPWNVAIYKKGRGESYDQICGGTLISPDLVISAAHCFYDDTVKRPQNAKNYAVAAGKFYRSYNWPEEFAEDSTVKKIDIPVRYYGNGRNYEQDIALVHLDIPFNISTLIRPVCMDWNNEYEKDHLRVGNSGKIVGWGRTEAGVPSPQLQEIDLPFTDYQNCISKAPVDFRGSVTADKFCAGHLNGSALCDGDSGGGLCFQSNGRWYLRGITSVGPSDRGLCDANFFTAFTNVGKFLDWIRKEYFNAGIHIRGPELVADTTTQSCTIPGQPQGGSFELRSCRGQCDANPGSKVPIGSYLVYKCNEGWTLSGNDVSFCYEEGWYAPPTCIETKPKISCPALRSRTVNFNCNYNGESVPCESPMAPGTKAVLACKEYYKMLFFKDPGYREITCTEGGAWDHPVFDCIPECGTAVSDKDKLSVDGSKVKHNKFPWRVHVYQKNSTTQFRQRIFGTLISPDLVIVQANAFTDGSVGMVPNSSDWAVGAGKYYKNYNESEPFAQRSLVESIDIAKGYAGNRGNYSHNIALLRLRFPLNMTALVRPICMDWTQALGFSRNDSKENAQSYIPAEKCRSRSIVAHRRLLSDDTFCTDCKPAVGSCDDSNQGEAFACQSQGLWYLLGRFKRNPKPLSGPCKLLYAYTRLGSYLDWIRAAYDASAV